MKRVIIIFFLFNFVFGLFTNEKDVTSDSEDKGKFTKISKYDTAKILYWTSYGTTGLFAVVNSFAYLGYAVNISKDIKETSDSIKSATNILMPTFTNMSESLPFIYFGYHFLLAGFAFIPYYGGVLYGSFLYLAGILVSIIRMFNPIDMFWQYEVPSNLAQSYRDRLVDIHHKIFDPVSYFVLGTFAIIFGVCEIISYYFYRKQINKIKYPIMHKILTFSLDGSIIIKLPI
ncbi:MAG TPA: hypothetical protein PLE45_05460 [Spirochaetota bacterium]|nr:hypothetical protein [Spirochaetota bacterium]HOL56749.1 hypothetical protein [Spirochaetota bacterium]HPP04181.1 hypothetical protein [Spirochaetota bacterium]